MRWLTTQRLRSRNNRPRTKVHLARAEIHPRNPLPLLLSTAQHLPPTSQRLTQAPRRKTGEESRQRYSAIHRANHLDVSSESGRVVGKSGASPLNAEAAAVGARHCSQPWHVFANEFEGELQEEERAAAGGAKPWVRCWLKQQEVLLLPRLEVRKHSTSPWCRAPQCSAGAVAVGAGVGVAAVAKGGDGAIPVQEQGQVVLRQRRNPDRR